MSNKTRGYPLPDGDCYTEDLCPVVICVPNKDEYFRALWGTLFYLATWIAWERDDDKRGKDAAASWQFANEAMEIGDRMGCLQDLQDDVSNILLLLQNKKDCCDTSMTHGPSTEVETDIMPDSGDPPDYYGETAVTDWDDWKEHVCYNANLWVDDLIRQAQTIEQGLAVGAIALGLVVGAVGLIGFLATGGLLSIPLMMAASAALAAGGSSSMFNQAADDLEAARDDIVCALILGTSVSDAIENALTIGASWTLFFSIPDYSTATSILYEGGQGTNYLPSETSDACDCGVGYGDLLWQWTAGAEGWNYTSRADFGLPSLAGFPGVDYDGWAARFNGKNPNGNAAIKITGNEIRDQAGLGPTDNMTLRRIHGIFWNAGVDFTKMGVVRLRFEDLTIEDFDTGILSATPEYMEWDVAASTKNIRAGNNFVLEVIHEHNGSTSDRYMFVDDLTAEWIE